MYAAPHTHFPFHYYRIICISNISISTKLILTITLICNFSTFFCCFETKRCIRIDFIHRFRKWPSKCRITSGFFTNHENVKIEKSIFLSPLDASQGINTLMLLSLVSLLIFAETWTIPCWKATRTGNATRYVWYPWPPIRKRRRRKLKNVISLKFRPRWQHC